MKSQSIARVERIEPPVWTPKAKLYIPHGDQEIIFAYPAFQGNYQTTGRQILEKISGKDLSIPTAEQTVSLLHTTYCNPSVSREPEFQEIKNLMKSNWLWVFNQNLWTSEGVYVVQDSNAKGINKSLNVNELEEILKNAKENNGLRISKDKKVRFAPKETYKLGNHTSDSLAKDGFIIASYDEKGAEKIAEISQKFRVNPYVYGLNIFEGKKPKQKRSALYESVDRLRVSGGCFVGFDRCHAFGVLNSREADAKN